MLPLEARYEAAFGDFVLPYEMVCTSGSPDAALLEFLQSTYEAAADLAHWNLQALERSGGWRAP